MADFNTQIGVWDIVRTGTTQGLGLGFIFVPLSTISFATLAPHYRNEGTSMYSLLRNIGSSIGVSVCFTLLARNTQVNRAELVEHLTPFRTALQQPWLPAPWDWTTAAGAAALSQEVNRQAATIAYLNDFRMMMYVTLLAIPLLLLVKRPAARPAGAG